MNLKILLGMALSLSPWHLVHSAPHLNGIESLKRLEAQVKEVAKKAMPTTVSLISPDQAGSGSGVIVSQDGLILTAAHVVQGYREMIVVFPDGKQEKAQVLGANESRDSAMVQILGQGPWPFSEVGDSDELKVGDFVVALGHPKGFDPTRKPPVRFGRIMTRHGIGFLTSDCTLIGGDSGGPLFDISGKVVGIHSHIAPDKSINNHAEISGFKRSWEKMKSGRVWGALGVDRRADRNRPILGVFLITGEGGAMRVDQVPKNSPAEKAGLQVGDVLLKIQGELLRDDQHVQEVLIDYEPGDEIKVVVRRDQAEVETSLVLGSARLMRRSRR